MRVVHEPQPGRGEGLENLDERMRRVAHAHDLAQRKQTSELRRERRGRRERDAAAGDRIFYLAMRARRLDAELRKNLGARDAAWVGVDAMHQHRHAFAREQEREQRHEVRLFARAVVAWNRDGEMLAVVYVHRLERRVRGG